MYFLPSWLSIEPFGPTANQTVLQWNDVARPPPVPSGQQAQAPNIVEEGQRSRSIWHPGEHRCRRSTNRRHWKSSWSFCCKRPRSGVKGLTKRRMGSSCLGELPSLSTQEKRWKKNREKCADLWTNNKIGIQEWDFPNSMGKSSHSSPPSHSLPSVFRLLKSPCHSSTVLPVTSHLAPSLQIKVLSGILSLLGFKRQEGSWKVVVCQATVAKTFLKGPQVFSMSWVGWPWQNSEHQLPYVSAQWSLRIWPSCIKNFVVGVFLRASCALWFGTCFYSSKPPVFFSQINADKHLQTELVHQPAQIT